MKIKLSYLQDFIVEYDSDDRDAWYHGGSYVYVIKVVEQVDIGLQNKLTVYTHFIVFSGVNVSLKCA